MRRLYKLINLLGLIQALRFLFNYLIRRSEPIPIWIKGIQTPLYCRVRDSDIRVLWQIFGEKWFDLGKIESPRLIVDGGAYTGYSSVFFATKYPNAHIIAVEPSRANGKLLRRNCEPYANIEIVHAAIWESNVKLQLDNPGDESWTLRVSEVAPSKSEYVRGVNLASLIDSRWFETIDVLKLDVEGAERSIFAKNYDRWLKRTRHMLIELHERYVPGCEAAFYSAIKDEPYWITEAGEYTILKRPDTWRSVVVE